MAIFNYDASGEYTVDSNAIWESGVKVKDYGDSIVGINDVGEISSDMGNGMSADLKTMERSITRVNRAKYAWPMQYPRGFTNTLSARFDGTNKYGLTTVDLSGATKVTISGWFYRVATTDRLDIDQSDNTNTLRFKLLRNSSGAVYGVIDGGVGYFNDNTTGWIFLTIVFDGTQADNASRMKLYKNGVAQTLTFSGTVPAVVSSIPNTLDLAHDDGSGSYGTGDLDEIMIGNGIALTPIEVLELYNLGTPSDLRYFSQWSNISHWWRMGDVRSGMTIPDQKGSSDCVLQNMSASDIVTNVPSASSGVKYFLSAGNSEKILAVPSVFAFGQSPVNTVGSVLIPDAVAIKGDGTNHATFLWDSSYRDNFVIEMRISPDTLTNYAGLFGGWKTGAKFLLIGFNQTTNKIEAAVSTDGTTTDISLSSDTVVVANSWYYIRVIYNSTDGLVLSIDGIDEDSGSYAGQLYNFNQDLYLFDRNGDSPAAWDGGITDFRMYPSAVKSGTHEVPDKIYRFDDNAKHAWNCEEASGVIAYDIGNTKTNGDVGSNIIVGSSGEFVDSKAFTGTSSAASVDNVVGIPWDYSFVSNFAWRLRMKQSDTDSVSGIRYLLSAMDVVGGTRSFAIRSSGNNLQAIYNNSTNPTQSQESSWYSVISSGEWDEVQFIHNGSGLVLSHNGIELWSLSNPSGLYNYNKPIDFMGNRNDGGCSTSTFSDLRFYTSAKDSNYAVGLGYYEKPAIQYQYATESSGNDPSPTWNGTWLDDFEGKTNELERYLYLKTRFQKQDVLLTNTQIENYTADTIPPSGLAMTETIGIGNNEKGVLVNFEEPVVPDYNYTIVGGQINGGSWYKYTNQACMGIVADYMQFKGYMKGSGIETEGVRNESYVALLDCAPIQTGNKLRARAKSFDEIGNESEWVYGNEITIGASTDYPEREHVLTIDTVNFESGLYVPADSGVVVVGNLYGEFGIERSGIFVCTPPTAPSGAELNPPPQPPNIIGVG